jgi:tetratricopeptide (TPR) repeat protein
MERAARQPGDDLSEHMRHLDDASQARLAKQFQELSQSGDETMRQFLLFSVHMANRPKRASENLLLSRRLRQQAELAMQLGDGAAARESYARALHAARQAEMYSPSLTEAQKASAQALLGLGYVALEEGQLEPARDRFEESLKTVRDLLTYNPNDPARRDLLASCLQALGGLESACGNVDLAIPILRESIDHLESLATEHGTVHTRLTLAKGWANLAAAYRKKESTQEAIDHLQRALTVADRLQREQPYNLEAAALVSQIADHTADLLHSANRYAEVVPFAEMAWKAQRRICEARVNDLAAQARLAALRCRMGAALQSLSRSEEARACFDDAEQIVLRMAARVPRDQVDRMLSSIREARGSEQSESTPALAEAQELCRQGEHSFGQGNAAEGFEKLEAAEAVLSAAAAADLSNGLLLNELSGLYTTLLLHAQVERQGERAAQYAQRAAQVQSRRNRLQSDPKQRGERLLNVTTGLAHLRAGNLTAARAAFLQDAQRAQAIAEANPADLNAKAELAYALDAQGSLSVLAGDLESALASYQRAWQLHEELLVQDPLAFNIGGHWISAFGRVAWLTLARGLPDPRRVIEPLATIERLAFTTPNELLNLRQMEGEWFLTGAALYWSDDAEAATFPLFAAFYYLHRVDRIFADVPDVLLDWVAVSNRLLPCLFQQEDTRPALRLLGFWLELARRLFNSMVRGGLQPKGVKEAFEELEFLRQLPAVEQTAVIAAQLRVFESLAAEAPIPLLQRELAFFHQLSDTGPESALPILQKLHETDPQDVFNAHALMHCLYQAALGGKNDDGAHARRFREIFARVKDAGWDVQPALRQMSNLLAESNDGSGWTVSIPVPDSRADPDRAAKLNIEHQNALRRWQALPWWRRITAKKPEPPSGI